MILWAIIAPIWGNATRWATPAVLTSIRVETVGTVATSGRLVQPGDVPVALIFDSGEEVDSRAVRVVGGGASSLHQLGQTVALSHVVHAGIVDSLADVSLQYDNGCRRGVRQDDLYATVGRGPDEPDYSSGCRRQNQQDQDKLWDQLHGQ